MNVTNLDVTQATIEIFGGLVCFMLAIIIIMNGHERTSWWVYEDKDAYYKRTGKIRRKR